MADINKNSAVNNAESKETIIPEKRIPEIKHSERLEQEINPEKITETKGDRIVLEELRREVDRMEEDENAKINAEKEKEKISFLGEEEKIKHLLQLAREKGVAFAIQVARKMNEPFLLDILHDTLASEGYFKDFSK